MNAALSARGQETLPQKLSFLAEQIGPAVATLGRRHFGRAAKASACQADGVSPRGLESHRCRACAKWLCVEGEYIASLGRDVVFEKTTSKSSRPGLARRHGTRQAKGLFWELNPGPLAPEARIMPLDQTASGAHVSSGTSNYCSPCCQPHGSAG